MLARINLQWIKLASYNIAILFIQGEYFVAWNLWYESFNFVFFCDSQLEKSFDLEFLFLFLGNYLLWVRTFFGHNPLWKKYAKITKIYTTCY